MVETRHSLLLRAQQGLEQAWDELVALYQPHIQNWLVSHGVAHHDAEELSQDVLAVTVRELPQFAHSGRRGAFRTWLRRITANRARVFWRAGKIRPKAQGGSAFLQLIEQLEDNNSSLAHQWDREHDQHLLRALFQSISPEFSDNTMEAFRRLVFHQQAPETVASDLDMSVGAVYSAKSRVMRRFRQEAEGLVNLTDL